MWGYCRWVERICKTFKKKTKLTICKYFKHVWKCFVWHRDAHWEIIYRRRVGVFCLRFNDHRDLTNTQERKCQIWHPSTFSLEQPTEIPLCKQLKDYLKILINCRFELVNWQISPLMPMIGLWLVPLMSTLGSVYMILSTSTSKWCHQSSFWVKK